MKKKTSFSQIVGSAAVGNVLEYYDFTLFVYLAPHIGPLFFPAGDNLSAIIAALGIFALGYFMRPIGAILFGYIGDTYGRKMALSTSIIMMAIPTMCIGFLPTYASIGIASPILLTMFRLLQGLCVGGEYNGAGIFAVENVENKRALAGSFVTSSSALGGLCGSAVAGFVLLPFMPSWAWRGAFIAGAFIAVFGLYVRLKVTENNPVAASEGRAPFLEALKHHPRSIFCTMGIAAFSGIMFYLSLSYVSVFLTTVKQWPITQSLAIVSFGMVLYILLVPFVGKMADRYGAKITMLTGTIATIVAIFPIFLLLTQATNILGVLLSVSLLVMLSAWFQAPMNYYFTTLFPPKCRYSGIAFSYAITMAIFGGTTPMILSFLIRWAGTPLVSVAYVLLGASLGLLALLKAHPYMANDTRAKALSKEAQKASLLSQLTLTRKKFKNSSNSLKDKKPLRPRKQFA